jgi:hypothetical protein
VTDDGTLAANRAQPGEQFQRDLGHPGSVLFSGSGSAIKRITAGVKAGPDRRCQVSIWWLAFTLQVKSVPNEKRISRSAYCPHDLVYNIGRFKTTTRSEPGPTANPSLLNGDSDRRALRARYNSAEGCLYWTIGWPPL